MADKKLDSEITEEQLSEVLRADRELAKVKAEYIALKRKYDRSLKDNETLEESLNTALAIKDFTAMPPIVPLAGQSSEIIPILVVSDWHVGASVKPATVAGVNEYDPSIAEERANYVFRNVIKVLQPLRLKNPINTIVLAILGDIIDNWIHPDQIETNYLTPIEEIIFAEKLLATGINYLLDHGDFEQIIIPCAFGNHGRFTEKMRSANANVTSLEWMMYKALERHFRNNARVKWIVPDSAIFYYEIAGKTIRFTHGYQIRYNGGVNGLAVPASKWLYRQNAIREADMTFIGHFHNLTFFNNLTVNGSLIGATAYSINLGFPAEPPQQALRLVDSKRGFTACFPIFCN